MNRRICDCGTARKAGLSLWLIATLVGCAKPLPVPPEHPLTVRAQVVKFIEHKRKSSLTGEFRARIQSDLSFRIGGRIASRKVDVGDRVKPGDVLASIDTLQQTADVTAAKAGVRSAEATLQQASGDLKRMESLLESKAASKAEYDNAKATFLTAQGSVNISKSVLETAQSQLSFTEIKANSPGVVVSRNAEVGQVVASAQTVFTVAEDGEREAVFDVFQTHITNRPVDDKISLTLISDPSVKTIGVIREIAPSIDASTGTVRVKVTVPNPPSQMTLGAPVLGQAIFSPIQVVELPWTVLMREGDEACVWIVDPTQKTVQQRVIEVETYVSGVLLITNGLKPGDIVVVDGAQLLRPGQKVNIVEEPTSNAELAGANP